MDIKVYLLLFVITLSACSKNDFEIGTEEEFKAKTVYFSESGELKFEIYKIEDSRCPENVLCFWEGEARIYIKSIKPEKKEIVLSTYDNIIDTLLNYKFSLIEVNPYPKDVENPINLKDFRVKMKVEEL